MKIRTLSLTLILTSSLAVCHPLFAAEGLTPLQPGTTTGTHTGALPPDGLYLSMTSTYESGVVRDGSGNKANVTGGKNKLSNVGLVMAVTWVPGWDVLGARYAAMVVQPYKFIRLRNTGLQTTNHTSGFLGTSVTPLSLSWDLHNNFHIGAGLAIYIPDGKTAYTRNATTGKKETSGDNVSYDYWSFEPNIAISYLTDDWGITLNNIFDFNCKNTETDYHSGSTYYLDVTATHRISKNLTAGLIGNWTKQVADDKINGKTVQGVEGIYSTGRRVEHIKAGPMLSYNVNGITITGRLLFNLHSENDSGMTFFHIGMSMPL
ncbi:transporter [Klebsiella sp. 2680]|uniref:SphA family protein n=1 Tax=Klebsiella sp. 2680 TaxID=2018037 RepID=UPI00163C28B8|nr:transporter [Klebsiella sp. 2680]